MAGATFFAQGVFAQAAESNFWRERRRALAGKASPDVLLARLPAGAEDPSASFSTLPSPAPLSPSSRVPERLRIFRADDKLSALLAAIPPSLGDVRRVVMPPSGKPARAVVLIQDVHANEEAQRNIGGIVERLAGTEGAAGLVGLEGAFEPLDLRAFRAFPDRDAVRDAAADSLKRGRISGPVCAALRAPAPGAGGGGISLVGVDDPVHHPANVEAYRRAEKSSGTIRRELDGRRSALEAGKARVFGPALREFDGKIGSYRSGKTALADYVRAVAPGGIGGGSVPEARSQTLLFLRALDMERALDFARVQRERTELLRLLTGKLSRERLGELAEMAAAYRSGNLMNGDFYRSLRDFCSGAGVPLVRFPAVDAYIRYALAADAIDAAGLLSELPRLEALRYDALAKTPEEKRLVADSRRLFLAAKLSDFSLTPEEWREYDAPRRGGVPEVPGMSAFEDFYREARLRDAALSGNLLKAMDARKASSAVLVAGGFHTEGVAARLAAAGAAVVVMTPKLTKVESDEGSAYLSVFTREKTPLEKLFAGETLFLAQDPLSPAAKSELGLTAGNLREARTRGGVPASQEKEEEVGFLPPGASLVEHRTVPGGAEAEIEERDGGKVVFFTPVRTGAIAGPPEETMEPPSVVRRVMDFAALSLRLTYPAGRSILRSRLARRLGFGMENPTARDVELKVAPWFELLFSILPFFVFLHDNRDPRTGRIDWMGKLLPRTSGWLNMMWATALPFLLLPAPAGGWGWTGLILLSAALNAGAHWEHNKSFPDTPLTSGAPGPSHWRAEWEKKPSAADFEDADEFISSLARKNADADGRALFVGEFFIQFIRTQYRLTGAWSRFDEARARRVFRALYYNHPDLAAAVLASFGSTYHDSMNRIMNFGGWLEDAGKPLETGLAASAINRALVLLGEKGPRVHVGGQEIKVLATDVGLGGLMLYPEPVEDSSGPLFQEIDPNLQERLVRAISEYSYEDLGLDPFMKQYKALIGMLPAARLWAFAPETRAAVMKVLGAEPFDPSKSRVKKIRPLKLGKASGRLVVLRDPAPDLSALQSVPAGSIVAMEFLPPRSDDRVGPFAGLLTYQAEGETSHALAQADAWAVPYAQVPGPEAVEKWEGKEVLLEVTPEGVSLRVARATEPPPAPSLPLPPVVLPPASTDGKIFYVAGADAWMRDPARVGHKVADLVRLADDMPRLSDPGVQLRAEEGGAMTAAAFFHLLRRGGSLRKFQWLIRRLNAERDPARVNGILADIRALIRGDSFDPALLRRAVAKASGGNFLDHGLFVRSTVNAQDIPAVPGFGSGTYLTVPNVVGEGNVWRAVKESFASVWSERAFHERRSRRVDESTVAPMVWLVPSLEQENYAFFLRTARTSAGHPEAMVVELVQGLGIALAESDIVGRPTQIVLNRSSGEILSKEPSEKRQKVVLARTGGVRLAPNDPSLEFLARPDADRLIAALWELGRQAQDNGGTSREIEGVIRRGPSGSRRWEVVLLQAKHAAAPAPSVQRPPPSAEEPLEVFRKTVAARAAELRDRDASSGEYARVLGKLLSNFEATLWLDLAPDTLEGLMASETAAVEAVTREVFREGTRRAGLEGRVALAVSGSLSRGEMLPSSDLDLWIVALDGSVDAMPVQQFIDDALRSRNHARDLSLYTLEELRESLRRGLEPVSGETLEFLHPEDVWEYDPGRPKMPNPRLPGVEEKRHYFQEKASFIGTLLDVRLLEGGESFREEMSRLKEGLFPRRENPARAVRQAALLALAGSWNMDFGRRGHMASLRLNRPDLKDGPGGARDYLKIRQVEELMGEALLTPDERRRARELFLRIQDIRARLAWLKRESPDDDLLALLADTTMAGRPGWRERLNVHPGHPSIVPEPEVGLVQEIYAFTDDLFEIQRAATLRALREAFPRRHPLFDPSKGFVLSREPEADSPSTSDFERDPALFVTLFERSAGRGSLVPQAALDRMRLAMPAFERAMESALAAAEGGERNAFLRETSESFLRLLGDPARNPMPLVWQMQNAGVLGRFIPELGRAWRVPHAGSEAYLHPFAIDAHPLNVADWYENMTAWFASNEGAGVESMKKLKDRFLWPHRNGRLAELRLAFFLHDVGKPAFMNPPDTEVDWVGAHELAPRVLSRLGWPEGDPRNKLVRRLILNDNLLFKASTDEAEDPVSRFLPFIKGALLDEDVALQDPESGAKPLDRVFLNLLPLLAVSDGVATNPRQRNVVNVLTQQLIPFTALLDILEGEGTVDVADAIHQTMRETREQVLSTKIIKADPARMRSYVDLYFNGTPFPFWLGRPTNDIAGEIQAMAELDDSGAPARVLLRPPKGPFPAEVLVMVPQDRPGLFSEVTGVMAAQGLGVLMCQVSTGLSGWVLDRFQVRFSDPGAEKDWIRTSASLEEGLRKVLEGRSTVGQLFPGGYRIRNPFWRHPAHVSLKLLPDGEGLLRIRTGDFDGFLHAVTTVLDRGFNLNLEGASVYTASTRAVDLFRVSPSKEGPRLEEVQKSIEAVLRHMLSREWIQPERAVAEARSARPGPAIGGISRSLWWTWNRLFSFNKVSWETWKREAHVRETLMVVFVFTPALAFLGSFFGFGTFSSLVPAAWKGAWGVFVFFHVIDAFRRPPGNERPGWNLVVAIHLAFLNGVIMNFFPLFAIPGAFLLHAAANLIGPLAKEAALLKRTARAIGRRASGGPAVSPALAALAENEAASHDEKVSKLEELLGPWGEVGLSTLDGKSALRFVQGKVLERDGSGAAPAQEAALKDASLGVAIVTSLTTASSLASTLAAGRRESKPVVLVVADADGSLSSDVRSLVGTHDRVLRRPGLLKGSAGAPDLLPAAVLEGLLDDAGLTKNLTAAVALILPPGLEVDWTGVKNPYLRTAIIVILDAMRAVVLTGEEFEAVERAARVIAGQA